MKQILFGLSLLACVAGANAGQEGVPFPECISFAPAGFCDAMQFDEKNTAIWRNYDCAGSEGAQTTSKFYIGKTTCTAASGCNPSAAYGWDSLNWKFDRAASTGTLTGSTGGSKVVLQQNMPVSIAPGACSVNESKGGVSSLSR